mgnify:CR=1 FL=1
MTDGPPTGGEGLTDDAFLGGRLRLWQPRPGFRSGTDAVLLAAACPARAGQSVLDLGCGAGAVALCLGLRVPGLALAGLEIQPAYAALARRNAARAGLPLEVHEGSATAPPPALRRGFDHVVTNPPYVPPGTPPADGGRATAMQVRLPLADWVRAAGRRLVPGGRLTMILATARLPEALAGLGPLGSAAVLPLAARPDAAPGRVILSARKGGRAGFRILPPLVLHEGAGHSPAATAILRDGAPIDGL